MKKVKRRVLPELLSLLERDPSTANKWQPIAMDRNIFFTPFRGDLLSISQSLNMLHLRIIVEGCEGV